MPDSTILNPSQLSNFAGLKSHTVYENNIDNRKVKCGCGSSDCKIGLNFDSGPNVMRLTDKFGNEYTMHLTKENVKEIIEWLKGFKFK